MSNSSRPRVNGRKRSPSPPSPEPIGGDNLGDYGGEDTASGGQVSLAHELAAAMMPQPTTSRLLAEEFGLEFEDGLQEEGANMVNGGVEDDDEEHIQTPGNSPHHSRMPVTILHNIDPEHSSLDPFTTVTQDMERMDTFLTQLRHLDGEPGSVHEPTLEKAASELIRRLNETIRDREDQVRQLLELEREFRRISSEVGGGDVLGTLDELEIVEGLTEETPRRPPLVGTHSCLSSVAETDEEEWEKGHRSRQVSISNEDVASPISPSSTGNELATASSAIPHVARFRTDTKSLAVTLTALSEQTQVNGATAAEAGRKIRALKNKLGGWQADWASAERSRQLIETWESSGEAVQRIGAEQLKEEQINAFQAALDEAAHRTQMIMTVA